MCLLLKREEGQGIIKNLLFIVTNVENLGLVFAGWPRRLYTNTVHTHQIYRTILYIFRKKIPYIPYIHLYRTYKKILLYLYRTHKKIFFCAFIKIVP